MRKDDAGEFRMRQQRSGWCKW